jgi:hypothetical protein
VIAVTSFSETGYHKYGKRFLEQAVVNWPTKLIVYYEVKPDFVHERVEYRNLFDLENLRTFLLYLQDKPITKGDMPDGYNYNFDAWKFCRKSFVQFDVLKDAEEKVFWLDADIELKKSISEDFLESLFVELKGDDERSRALACFWREGFHSETGFIGFDPKGEKFQEFLQAYIDVYRRGTLFTLKRWHDCAAFDHAVTTSGVPIKNLSKFYLKNKTPLGVMSQSVLKSYMDHLKGDRKYGQEKAFKE